jgi:hypothetical protein
MVDYGRPQYAMCGMQYQLYNIYLYCMSGPDTFVHLIALEGADIMPDARWALWFVPYVSDSNFQVGAFWLSRSKLQ